MKTKKTIKVYFCPKCRSTEVHHPFRISNAFGIIPKWECSKCKFSAPAFPIGIINKDKIDKLNKKTNKKK